jgi:hypothetical protein
MLRQRNASVLMIVCDERGAEEEEGKMEEKVFYQFVSWFVTVSPDPWPGAPFPSQATHCASSQTPTRVWYLSTHIAFHDRNRVTRLCLTSCCRLTGLSMRYPPQRRRNPAEWDPIKSSNGPN